MQDCGSLSAPYRKKLGGIKTEQPHHLRCIRLEILKPICQENYLVRISWK